PGATRYPVPDKPPPILIAAARQRAVAQAGRYADIVALGTRSRDFLSQQVAWLRAAAGQRFESMEIACYTFVVPENRPEAVANVAAVVQRSFGFDLQQAIVDKAPNGRRCARANRPAHGRTLSGEFSSMTRRR